MIVTLYLISANVYNSVEAPSGREFSPIEVWMLGTQIPILLALFEYGFVLYLKKIDIKTGKASVTEFRRTKALLPIEMSEMTKGMMDSNDSKKVFDNRIKKLDFATMIFSFSSFTIFALLCWTILYK
mgnify:CR=1 FL=1